MNIQKKACSSTDTPIIRIRNLLINQSGIRGGERSWFLFLLMFEKWVKGKIMQGCRVLCDKWNCSVVHGSPSQHFLETDCECFLLAYMAKMGKVWAMICTCCVAIAILILGVVIDLFLTIVRSVYRAIVPTSCEDKIPAPTYLFFWYVTVLRDCWPRARYHSGHLTTVPLMNSK